MSTDPSKNNQRLRESVIVITGATQGLGFSTARRLAEEGATVVIADTRSCADKLDQWPSALRDCCMFRQTDVRNYDTVRTLADEVVGLHGRVDVLINNASMFSSLNRKPFLELDSSDWERSLSVNVLGTFHCTKAFAPHMMQRKQGRIINVASNAVFKGLSMLLDYVAAKGAVVAMTQSLARELGAYHITVNGAVPGNWGT